MTAEAKIAGAVIGLVIVVFAIGFAAVRQSDAASDSPMRAASRLQINDCVELITVEDPSYGERYLVAWDKCGATSVAIAKRF